MYLGALERDTAPADVTAAIELEPWYGWFHDERALTHYRKGDYERAVEDLVVYTAQYHRERIAHFSKGRT